MPMNGAEDWAWTTLTGIIQGWGLVDKVIRVEACAGVAKMADVPLCVCAIGSYKCNDVEEKGRL